jgi:hypothetical protein
VSDRRERNRAYQKAYYEKNKVIKKAYQKAYYEKNKVAALAYAKAYREKNGDSISASEKAYREKNKAMLRSKRKAYREKNKAKIAAREKAYYERNKGSISAREKAYYEKNKVAALAYQKAHREKNRALVIAYHQAYREKNKAMLSSKRKAFIAKARAHEAARIAALASSPETQRIISKYLGSTEKRNGHMTITDKTIAKRWRAASALVHEGEYMKAQLGRDIVAVHRDDGAKVLAKAAGIHLRTAEAATRSAEMLSKVPDRDVWLAVGAYGVRALVGLPSRSRRARTKVVLAEWKARGKIGRRGAKRLITPGKAKLPGKAKSPRLGAKADDKTADKLAVLVTEFNRLVDGPCPFLAGLMLAKPKSICGIKAKKKAS